MPSLLAWVAPFRYPTACYSLTADERGLTQMMANSRTGRLGSLLRSLTFMQAFSIHYSSDFS